MTLLRPLRARNFRLLWAGQAISSLGDPLFPFAVAFLALETGRGAAGVGLVFGARSLAGALVTLLGGVMADTFSRRRTMIAADLARAGLIAVIALLPAGVPTPAVAALVFLVGTGESVFRPAYNALLPATLPADLRQSGNALTAVTIRTNSLLGPALAGLLVALAGPRPALLADAASFLASIAAVTLIQEGATDRTRPAQALLPAAAQGVRAVLARRWIAIMVGAAFVQVSLSVAPWSVLLPVVARARLGGSPAYAALLVAFGTGGVLGGLFAARIRTSLPGVVGCLGLTPFAIALAALAVPLPLWMLVACHATAGAGLEIYNVLWATALQRDVPPDLLGRVFSVDQLGTLALTPLAYGLVGPAAQAAGVTPVLLVGAAATAAATWLPLLDAGVRRFGSARLEQPPAPEDEQVTPAAGQP